MIDILKSIATWQYWSSILSVLVIVHLISEYWHYAWEYFSGRREANILKDIQKYRKQSTKTARIIHIQIAVDALLEDINQIKKELNIKEVI